LPSKSIDDASWPKAPKPRVSSSFVIIGNNSIDFEFFTMAPKQPAPTGTVLHTPFSQTPLAFGEPACKHPKAFRAASKHYRFYAVGPIVNMFFYFSQF
jgi:hypothetical protein